MNRLLSSLVLGSMLILAACTSTGTVTTSKALEQSPVKKVVVVVVSCHPEMNCSEIENKTVASLRGMRPSLNVEFPSNVRSVLLEGGHATYTADLRQEIADATGSDAILEIHVPYGKEGIYGWRQTKVTVKAALVRPDGKLLANGEASRKSSTVSSPEGTVAVALKKEILPSLF